MDKSEAGFVKAMARELLVASVASGRPSPSASRVAVGERDIRIALSIAEELLREAPEGEDNK